MDNLLKTEDFSILGIPIDIPRFWFKCTLKSEIAGARTEDVSHIDRSYSFSCCSLPFSDSLQENLLSFLPAEEKLLHNSFTEGMSSGSLT